MQFILNLCDNKINDLGKRLLSQSSIPNLHGLDYNFKLMARINFENKILIPVQKIVLHLIKIILQYYVDGCNIIINNTNFIYEWII